MRIEHTLVLDLSRGKKHLLGATLGQDIFEVVLEPALPVPPDTAVLLSCRGAQYVTGSILKATWLQLVKRAPGSPIMLADAASDVLGEFDMFLGDRHLAGLVAQKWTRRSVLNARLHGHLEPPGRAALRALVASPGSTAPELHEASDELVSATAWTNRLNELHRAGLAVREKAGRAWRFFPAAKEVEISDG